MNADYRRLREIWRSCYKRCENPRCKDYGKYGAKGIRMYPPWREDFNTFYQWAITHGYRNDLTLERVSVNRGYNPGNCIWVSRKAQAYNRRTNTRYTIDGHTKTLQEWAQTYGVPPDVIVHRLEDGWGLEEAIKTPRKGRTSARMLMREDTRESETNTAHDSENISD